MRRPVPTGVLADLNRLDVVPGSGARVLRGPLPDQSAVIGVLIDCTSAGSTSAGCAGWLRLTGAPWPTGVPRPSCTEPFRTSRR